MFKYECVMKALQCRFDLTWQRRGSWERDLARGVSMAKVEIAFVASWRWRYQGNIFYVWMKDYIKSGWIKALTWTYVSYLQTWSWTAEGLTRGQLSACGARAGSSRLSPRPPGRGTSPLKSRRGWSGRCSTEQYCYTKRPSLHPSWTICGMIFT